MIHLDYVDRHESPQTLPVVCMHCDSPTCAEVCPADAIKRTEDGVVQSARKPRCIACNNCVLACPFGVPKMDTRMELMMKCDMCYDRTSEGKRPMCATVCPSQALFFGTREEIERLRPRSRPINEFHFGGQTIHTKVRMMVPVEATVNHLDVADGMFERADERPRRTKCCRRRCTNCPSCPEANSGITESDCEAPPSFKYEIRNKHEA